MSDKCPFCGVYFMPVYGMSPQYQCGTLAHLENTPDAEKRSPKCYEAEISTLKTQLAQAKVLLEKGQAQTIYGGDDCQCEKCILYREIRDWLEERK